MPAFSHLNVHTQFSLRESTARIADLTAAAAADGQPAMAITDSGNLFGVPEFTLKCREHGLKPVIGCEFYLAENSMHEPRSKQNRTRRLLLLAKTEEGYLNLVKLSSAGYLEGFHYTPRIDKALLEQHAGGLICTTGSQFSEVCQKLLYESQEAGENAFRYYHELFGEDFYVELHRNGKLFTQKKLNKQLLRLAETHGVKAIAANNVHYLKQEDHEAHDLLTCMLRGQTYNDPNRHSDYTDDKGRLNPHFYLKTQEEMAEAFEDLPELLANTQEIVDKCAFELPLDGQMKLPVYEIPDTAADMDDYLAQLTWQGAEAKYGGITPELQERIERELAIIRKMGYAGYFLIVQEFTAAARHAGVLVGPGRGSAAGSVVAYCVGIIDVDPMRYKLFFERFLNPERVSPPDIDIDFDDAGRQKVIDFVSERYGRESVSQIITFGTMGPKTAILDVGRALEVELPTVRGLTNLIPEKPGMTFEKALSPEHNPDHAGELNKAFEHEDETIRKLLRFAHTLEGTPRHTGIHAAGVIIAPGKLTDYLPLYQTKEKITTTQFDGPKAELAGLLKMDFLGLRTLSILKTAVQNVEKTSGQRIDPDAIPLDDEATYALFQRAETVATFQFESDGMRRYLRSLKPTHIEDLIAMNALYRPGPMDNIPSFIRRKHGQEAVSFPHPLLEPILDNTYGIMVYQEQIMEAAKVLAGYSLGGADLLRRAMGKKKKEVMDKEREKFVAGAWDTNGIEEKQANDIFDLMAKFAGYGFNKSHAAAYSLVAFRTAYLKANHPAEYMAAVLSHNLHNIDSITAFIGECRRMALEVRPPSVNESDLLFAVNPEGQIHYGLGAIKGVGESVAQAIIDERQANGAYESVFDLCARLEERNLTRSALESLANAGAFDCFTGTHRAQYFAPVPGSERNVLELALQYGQTVQAERNSQQINLFGGGGDEAATASAPPKLPHVEPMPVMTALNREREVIGFYLSGHPLDSYRAAIECHATTTINELEQHKGRDIKLAAIVTDAQERTSRKGAKFGRFTIEDYGGKLEFTLFGEDYVQLKSHLEINNCVLLQGRFEAGFRGEGNDEFRPNRAQLLEAVLATQTRRLILELELKQLTDALLEELDQLFQNHQGHCQVDFVIRDDDYEHSLKLASRNRKVQPETELLQALESWFIDYRVTTS